MKALLSLALLASLGSAALAQSNLILSGALTASDPIWRRPRGLNELVPLTFRGEAAAYDVFAFNVSASGTYVGEMNSPDTLDTYLLIYANAFDPANPLTNLVNGDDDALPGESFTILSGVSSNQFRKSRIATNGADNYAPGTGLVLTAGVTYYAVATGFDNANDTSGDGLGSYAIGLGGGPGNVAAGSPPVPEPASMAALGLGLVALVRRKRKA